MFARSVQLLLSVAVAMTLNGGAAAAATSPDYYGLNVNPLIALSSIPQSRWATYLQPMTSGQMTLGRTVANWSWAEPTAPVGGVHSYSWAPPSRPTQSLDAVATALARQGVRMVPVLSVPPAWAGGPGAALAVAHYADFAAFAGAYAGRYGPNGSFWATHPELPYLPALDFEVWTEANSANFWTGRADAAEYMRAMALIAPAIHQAAPGSRVLASLGWQSFEAYTNAIYAAGAKGLIDGIGFHPYAFYATAIVNLVQRMRAALVANGDPALPIDVTEIGQPVVYSGSGSSMAQNGAVTDAARAATQTLAGDALAHSDCGVSGYLLYAIVGTETSLEPIGEGYMGALNYQTGAPNVTGNALIAASLRWRGAPREGLVLCGSGATPPAALLPLGLTGKHVSPSCFSATTTYYGNPLEAAQLTLRTDDGRIARTQTDAFGGARVCVPKGAKPTAFDVSAEIDQIAASLTIRCSAASASSGCAFKATTATKPAWRVRLKVVRARGARARVQARITCPATCPKRVRVAIWSRRRSKAATTTRAKSWLRGVTLRPGKALTFTAKVRLRHLDAIVLTTKAGRPVGVPRLTGTARTPKAALRR